MTVVKARSNVSDWFTEQNPKLKLAEIGLELDTGKFKIGDGLTYWEDLSYVGGNGGSQPGASRWIGPYDFDFADWVEDTGSNFPGIPLVAEFPAAVGDIVLGCTVAVDTAFDGTGATVQEVALGVPGEDESALAAANPSDPQGLFNAVSGDVGGGFSVLYPAQLPGDNVGANTRQFIITGSGVGAWVEMDEPAQGHGRVWFCITTPSAP